MRNALKKLVIEGMNFNIMKAVYGKPTANIILNGEKTEIISSKVRNKMRVSLLPTPIQSSIGITSQSKSKRKK
jgi:hypothetical protein